MSRQELIAMLVDVQADLEALQRVVQRNMPRFKSPTLAKVRAALKKLQEEAL